MSGLFREKAIKNQSARLSGSASVATPVSSYLLLVSLLAAVAIALVFLFSTSFNRKEAVIGYIEPSKGVAKVFADRGGVLVQSFIANGAQVEKGQPIALIKVEQRNSDGELVHEMIHFQIESQIRTLKNRKININRQREMESAELTKRLELHKNNLKLNSSQALLVEERLRINQERLLNLAKLHQSGAVSSLVVSRHPHQNTFV